MKYNMFIGRYQSPHKGHMTIFNKYLDNNLPVLIAIRDVTPDEKNPLTAQEVKSVWDKIYSNNPLVKTIIIPDIDSVNYGRDVGYSITEINVKREIANISATEIRQQILSDKNEWREMVDSAAHELLINLLKK